MRNQSEGCDEMLNNFCKISFLNYLKTKKELSHDWHLIEYFDDTLLYLLK